MASRFLTLLPFLIAAVALADEGMWLFSNPPLKQLKEKYRFEPSPQWAEHLQKASVRFNSGGSGSFVSAHGLCITNHHVGPDALQKASTEQHNYLKEGFSARGFINVPPNMTTSRLLNSRNAGSIAKSS